MDSSYIEGLASICPVINWTIHGRSQINPILGIFCATPVNMSPATHCIFSVVCHWKFIMMSNDQKITFVFEVIIGYVDNAFKT
jgi:hypothetical protein